MGLEMFGMGLEMLYVIRRGSLATPCTSKLYKNKLNND